MLYTISIKCFWRVVAMSTHKYLTRFHLSTLHNISRHTSCSRKWSLSAKLFFTLLGNWSEINFSRLSIKADRIFYSIKIDKLLIDGHQAQSALPTTDLFEVHRQPLQSTLQPTQDLLNAKSNYQMSPCHRSTYGLAELKLKSYAYITPLTNYFQLMYDWPAKISNCYL